MKKGLNQTGQSYTPGPVTSLPLGSEERDRRVIEWLLTIWDSQEYTLREWDKALKRIEDEEIYKRFPRDNPVGSLDALIREVIGVSIPESKLRIEEIYYSALKTSTDIVSHKMASDISLINPFDFLREYARRHEPTGTWCYEKFEELNEKFFESKLTLPVIQWGITAWGRCLGYYEAIYQRILLHSSLMLKGGNAWGKGELLGPRFAEHVLLHELMHHKIYLDYGLYDPDIKKSHQCQAWADEINRIAPLLGLEVRAGAITQRRVKKQGEKGPGRRKWIPQDDSFISLKEMSGFPHSVMPKDYYEKETIDLLRQDFKM